MNDAPDKFDDQNSAPDLGYSTSARADRCSWPVIHDSQNADSFSFRGKKSRCNRQQPDGHMAYVCMGAGG
ncbi:hypothetical protein [Halothiobacillus diazotrophicus]|uniref:hypothetical protein n=1 Tax=Halothiobacillus diazotrophicus TaxID=1860122 RepID=UPI0018D43393|nr:hypothetical protein [Halothiobacillus diazotrophicus]